uniref:Alpha/beta hydrolase n=1 Tax=Janibacter limosus TaxID=53458 RepID=A0AC61U3K8_9MICO|nr:alpha/beta hydrolase [Janibacter limosus]
MTSTIEYTHWRVTASRSSSSTASVTDARRGARCRSCSTRAATTSTSSTCPVTAPPRSRRSRAGYSMGSHAEQFERLFGELGIERPHVVGNSLGGAMVLEMAHRGIVRSATALSPAGFFPVLHLPNVAANLLFMKGGSHLPEALHRKLNGFEWFRKLAFRSLYTHPEKVSVEDAVGDTLNLRRAKGFWPHFFGATFLRTTKHVIVPTTIGWGDTDRLLLPSEAKVARERLPEATHVSLPDCGHCPQIDHPELVVDLVVATMERAADATAV